MAQRQQLRKISGAGDAIERTKIIQQDSLEEQSSLSCGIMECLSHNEKESLEKWHSSQHANSQELRILAALPFFFLFFPFIPSTLATINLLPHHDYTGAPVGTTNQK